MQISKIFVSDPLGPKVRSLSMRERERLFFLLAQMVRSGQTAESSLRAVAKAFKQEKKDDLSAGLISIAQKVAQGRSLSKAMEAEYIMFSDVHRAAIMAGEAANNLYQAFSVLQKLEAQKMQAARSGMAELLTPAGMLLMSLASITNTGTNTLPAMVRVAQAQGKSISPVTMGVMESAHMVVHNWYLILTVMIVGAITFYSTIKTPQGRGWLDEMVLRIPGYGQYVAYKVYTSMLLYFPHLISSGVKPKQMIPIMEALATNQVLKRRIESFNQVITTGGQMSDAMDKAGFPPLAVTPVRVAENYAGDNRTGVNDAMVDGMNHSYEILDRLLQDNERRFVAIFSTFLWIAGAALMLTEMLSIVLSQT